MNKEGYHKFVFDKKNRKFIGEFEKMYTNEKQEKYDSWHQEDVSIIDKQICLKILNEQNFKTIVDIGCGKGALTNLMKTNENKVFGYDLSKTAISTDDGLTWGNFNTIATSGLDIVNRIPVSEPGFVRARKELGGASC